VILKDAYEMGKNAQGKGNGVTVSDYFFNQALTWVNLLILGHKKGGT